MDSTALLVDAPYALTSAQRSAFERDGFVKLPNVFDAATLGRYAGEISRLTMEHNKYKNVPLSERGTYGKAFLQVTNLWRLSATAREFSFSRRLARIAAKLLGVSGVRMWHDQALYKEPGGGPTPWHVDQQYWPMASDRSVTAWIPLQETPAQMGPLAFARGSHKLDVARNLPIGDESQRVIEEIVGQRGIEVVDAPFALGEVSFHLGWTLHRAGANTSPDPRRVHTVIYMDAQMRLLREMTETQRIDWQAFSPGTRPGEVMADPLTPVLYSNAE